MTTPSGSYLPGTLAARRAEASRLSRPLPRLRSIAAVCLALAVAVFLGWPDRDCGPASSEHEPWT